MNREYPRSIAVDLFNENFRLYQLEWYDASCISAELDFSNAENTVHPARLLLKMITKHFLKDKLKPIFTRTAYFHTDNSRKVIDKVLTLRPNFVLVGEYLGDFLFADDDMLFCVFSNGFLNCYSADPRVNEQLFIDLEDVMFLPTKEEPNLAYIIEQTSSGFNFRSFSLKERTVVEENYPEAASAEFQLLYDVVASEEPVGRLAVMAGPPGTGKTSLVRGLMNKFPKSKFVMIPPYLVASLASPQMISSILEFQEGDDRPLVLVLEDADSVLVKRGGDNMAHLSTLLNLADGVFTDTLDIRVVATTNADKVELDEAFERAGRLGCYIEIAPLPVTQAEQVYKRLMEDDEAALPEPLCHNREVKLCDIYDIVKRYKAKQAPMAKNKKKKLGF